VKFFSIPITKSLTVKTERGPIISGIKALSAGIQEGTAF